MIPPTRIDARAMTIRVVPLPVGGRRGGTVVPVEDVGEVLDGVVGVLPGVDEVVDG